MTPSDRKKVAGRIYAKHNIHVKSWSADGYATIIESSIPRSFFDFIDDADKAAEEIAELLQ